MLTKLNFSHAAVLITIFTVAGCANTADNYQPIVDGPKNAAYTSDLSACQQLSRQREYLNGDTKTSAIIGATLGALAGAGGNSGDLLGGAIAGSLIGGGTRAVETRDERKGIVIQCMRQRGHNAVG